MNMKTDKQIQKIPAFIDFKSALPKEYYENWSIHLLLTGDASVDYARKIANASIPKKYWGASSGLNYEKWQKYQSVWCGAFDKALKNWYAVNPDPKFWADGYSWPEDALRNFGMKKENEARAIMARWCVANNVNVPVSWKQYVA